MVFFKLEVYIFEKRANIWSNTSVAIFMFTYQEPNLYQVLYN